jgi:hypothetical protein
MVKAKVKVMVQQRPMIKAKVMEMVKAKAKVVVYRVICIIRHI